MDTRMPAGNRMLYPLLITAAVLVIIFSLVGIAAMTGILPAALSNPAGSAEAPAAVPAPPARPDAGSAREAPKPRAGGTACADCGTVDSIRSVEVTGQATGLGAVTGGVAGALVGNQIGRGSGRTAMTIVGAGGGAYAGHEIEKNVRASNHYQIRVRMADGSIRNFYEAALPAWRPGDRVRVVNGNLTAAG